MTKNVKSTVKETESMTGTQRPKVWHSQQKLAALYGTLAGFIGATAYNITQGFYVTFMTGNNQKSVLGFTQGSYRLALGAITMSVAFFLGVFVASYLHRRIWPNYRYLCSLVSALSMATSTIFSTVQHRNIAHGAGLNREIFFDDIMLAFATGSLNTAFTKDGFTAIAVTFHTGSLVRLAQGVENHYSGGHVAHWAQHAIQYFSFMFGALVGGIVSHYLTGTNLLAVATLFAFCVALFSYFYGKKEMRAVSI